MSGHGLTTRGSPRIVVQYLEGGATTGSIDPVVAVARLEAAAAQLPIRDVCLGWQLPGTLSGPVAAAARRLGASVWLWHPLLAGDGRYVPDRDRVIGPSGVPVAAPGGMGEFSFDCAVRPGGRAAALQRLRDALDDGVAHGIAWDGVLLDKIRWPSPFADPSRDLGCFCDACSAEAMVAGVDVTAVRREVADAAATAERRVGLAAALLGGPAGPALGAWLSWRAEAITRMVATAAGVIATRGLRVALDVFAPSLSHGVGQDLNALATSAEMTKAMLYLGTHGPAGMAYELLGLARWLAAGGVSEPDVILTRLTGYPVPPIARLDGGSLPSVAFETELRRLRRTGAGAAAGIDSVRIEQLAVLDDESLAGAVAHAAQTGVPIVLSWDLWEMGEDRIAAVAEGVRRARAAHPEMVG